MRRARMDAALGFADMSHFCEALDPWYGWQCNQCMRLFSHALGAILDNGTIWFL